MPSFPRAAFADVIDANAKYAADFDGADLPGRAGQGLAVLTCMDSRIDPLAILGLQTGDAKILRNAGAQVTDEILQTLVLASHLLNVDRVLVMPHTRCKMASATEAEIHAIIAEESNHDIRSIAIPTIANQREALGRDVIRIRTQPFLPESLTVAGCIFDVDSGRIELYDL
ncbi:MAG: hypothetical protein CMH41_05835 [Micrococcales bacterium]|nr:hypothetical protein [Micrococcales bacterium]